MTGVVGFTSSHPVRGGAFAFEFRSLKASYSWREVRLH
jgi:hypothetical protein